MSDDFPSDDVSRDDPDFASASAAIDSPNRPIEELPPVEPPSAGFIVQLFLIPMFIVGAIIGVYLLFGKMASGNQDWRTLVTELRNGNAHRWGRAAMGLAHLLSHDQEQGEEGQKLSKNPEIAKALVEVLEEKRGLLNPTDHDNSGQAYLVTALGYMDQPKVVIPPLLEVLQENGDEKQDLRIKALTSISLIAFRTSERAEKDDRPLLVDELVRVPSLVDDVIAVTAEPTPIMRHMAVYLLGLLPSPESQQRLEVLLNDSDAEVKINAAIGLARQDSTAGWPVFFESLESAKENPDGQTGLELVILKNTLKAVEDLKSEWTEKQMQQLLPLIEDISENHAETRIRTDAVKTLQALKS